MNLPERTCKTDLSDAELLILDFLFNVKSCLKHMRQPAYSIHSNVPYSHGLDDEALNRTLERLMSTGIIYCDSEPDQAEAFFGLTPAGGRLWEIERRPDWSRYIEIWLELSEEGTERVSITCPAREAIEKYWALAIRCGEWAPLDVPFFSETTDPYIVYWKNFELLYRITFQVAEDTSSRPINQELEKCRFWWQSLRELDALNAYQPGLL